MHLARTLAATALLPLLVGGCSSVLPSAAPTGPTMTAGDPTPLAKCRVAKSSNHPLVTEWPASEKAHLQSLSSGQVVAVAYTGCELRIIDACRLPGSYGWMRTTLATDTVEIANADELYAKLPIGALSLEGELQRSGRLAVRTTVSGQLKLQGSLPTTVPSEGPCAEATHLVTAISVGSFKLLSGSSVQAGGSVSAGITGAEGGASRQETVLREAGVQSSCEQATDEAPHSQCASPIQLFLSPLQQQATADAARDAHRAGAVWLSFPAPEYPEETWTLRNQQGDQLCSLPCSEWVGPASGYYLQREKKKGTSVATIDLPDAFPHPPGTHLHARYRAQRGSPVLATITFYSTGLPVGILSLVAMTAGTVQLASGMDCDQADCALLGSPGLNLGMGIFYGGIAGASLWWYLWSHWERMETGPQPFQTGTTRPPVELSVGPGWVSGQF